MHHSILHGAAWAVLIAGCASAAAPAPSPSRAAIDSCASPPAAAPRDTIAIAFDQTVNPAPLIARQLTTSAGAVDCQGAPRDSGAYDLLRRNDTTFAMPRRSGLPVLRFATHAAADARDPLDGGADLVVTRDQRAIAYARSRADLLPVPLAWDRTYVLVAPSAIPVASVRDAVRGDARTPVAPFWWADGTLCTAHKFNGTNQQRTRLLIPAGDPVARDLAARIVAATPGLVVAAADSASFARAMDRGMDAGYLVALPRPAPAACPVTPWPARWTVTPPAETRPYAILRRGAVRISADADGLFRVVEPAP
jgi:hypothetical protein